jgi:hypothetical protein
VEKEKPSAGSGSATRNSVKQTIAAVRCIQAFDEADLDSKGILALLATFDF